MANYQTPYYGAPGYGGYGYQAVPHVPFVQAPPVGPMYYPATFAPYQRYPCAGGYPGVDAMALTMMGGPAYDSYMAGMYGMIGYTGMVQSYAAGVAPGAMIPYATSSMYDSAAIPGGYAYNNPDQWWTIDRSGMYRPARRFRELLIRMLS